MSVYVHEDLFGTSTTDFFSLMRILLLFYFEFWVSDPYGSGSGSGSAPLPISMLKEFQMK
jgi:hypothetical protein